MINVDSLPINGGVLMSVLAYGAFTYVISAPTIAARVIAKSSWSQHCPNRLHDELAAQQKPAKVIPNTDCRSMIGSFIPELGQLCDSFGNPDLSGGATQLLQQREQQRQAMQAKQRAVAASGIESRCDCAAATVSRDSSWLLYTGSFSWVTPPEITHLSSTLTRALQSPQCAGGGA